MLILEIPCFGILRSCTRKEHFVRCPSEYKVDAVIQSPTRLHSFLEVTSRSNLQSSTGQVQHRETHEVCHRGTRSFLLDRPAAITLLGRREKEEERERERERTQNRIFGFQIPIQAIFGMVPQRFQNICGVLRYW